MRVMFNGPYVSSETYSAQSDGRYVLAHECIDSWDLLRVARREERFIILDNGADELGTGMSGEQLRALIVALDPDVCILPDVLKKSPQTITRSEIFLSESEWLPRQPEWMGVAQGRTFPEFLSCFLHWAAHPDVKYIGIPYDMDFVVSPLGNDEVDEPTTTKDRLRGFRRLSFIRGHVMEMQHQLRESGKQIHLLGSTDLSEMYTLVRDRSLDSIRDLILAHDTTAPYAAAAANYRFVCSDDEISFGSGGKWWPALDFSVDLDSVQREILRWNLACYTVACRPMDTWTEEQKELVLYSFDESDVSSLLAHVEKSTRA